MNLRLMALFLFIGAMTLAAFLMVSSGPDPNAIPTSEEVSKRTMSPYCEGLLLSDCPSSDSARLRSRISEKVSSGWTNSQIDSWLVGNYGEQVLGKPSQFVSWLGPVIAIGAGLGALAFLLRKWSTKIERASEPAVTEEERLRVNEDLERFARGVTE